MEHSHRYSFVISLKIGTSFSGYAYSSYKEFTANPLEIGSHVWEASKTHRSLTTASCILFRPDGQFDSFGYSAEDRYTTLSTQEKTRWFLFRKFNNNFRTLAETDDILDETGKPMSAIEVFMAAIKFLVTHVSDKLRDRLRGVGKQKISLVILDHDLKQKSLLLKAAKEAGITYDVSIVTKTDAFLCYYNQSNRCLGRPFRPKADYLLLKATGKRVLLKVFDRKSRDCKFEHTIEGGGHDVNDRLLDHLQSLLGVGDLQQTEKWKEGLVNLKREIEFQKRKTKRKQILRSNTISISKNSLEGLWDQFVEFSKRPDLNKNRMVRINGEELDLDSDALTDICVESAESLAKKVHGVLKCENKFAISDIIMIGGYSASPFTQNAISQLFPNSKFHLDNESLMSELKGAVVYGHMDGTLGKSLECHISPGTIRRYLGRLPAEKVNIKNLRLMLIGPEGTGKTALFDRLLRYLQHNQSKGTYGHELYVERFTINLENSEALEEQDILDENHSLSSFTMKPSSSTGSLDSGSSVGYENENNADRDDEIPRIVITPSPDYLIPPDELRTQKSKKLRRQDSIETKYLGDPKSHEEISAQKMTSREKFIRVSVWDFGGGKQSFHTNHIFLSSDAIYLLVFKISEQESLHEMLKWMRSVGSYSSERKAENSIATPPILLVGTHSDLISGTEEEVKQKFDELAQSICDMDELVCIKDNVFGIFEIDNFSQDNSNIKELWDAILEVAPAQAQWDKILPIAWLTLEKELNRKKKSGQSVISLNEITYLAEEKGINLTDEQLQFFLRYLHFAGSILYFGDTSIKNVADSILTKYVILSPSWLVSAFESLITSPIYSGSRYRRLDFLWKMYTKTAMLDIRLLKELWKHRKSDNFLQNLDVLLAYMERVGLIAEPTFLYDQDISDQLDKYFFVPAMLPYNKTFQLPEDIKHKHAICPKTLCLVFSDGFLPPQAADKLMAACIANFELRKESGRAILRRDFGVFKVDFQWSLVVSIQDYVVKLTMYKQSPIQRITPGGGLQIRFFIEDTLTRIAELHQYKNLTYQYNLHCEPICNITRDILVPKKELEKRGTLPCCAGDKQHFLNKKHLKFWFELPQIEKTKEEFEILEELPSEILVRIPGERELARFSKMIGKNYQIFFIELGLKCVDIEQVELELQAASQSTRLMHMFDRWKANFRGEATIQRILETMISNNIDFTEYLDVCMDMT